MASTTDRRHARRFALSFPCRLRSPFRDFPDLAAVTLNISRTGMLVRLLKPLPAGVGPEPGQLVEANVELAESANRNRSLHCEGVVIRVERGESPVLALRVRRMEFRQRTSLPYPDAPSEFLR
ncbi:MAG: PilZ domain-containing protein [Bryobacterales bacterium]|nr:PilZ domain-containing protein [Bryobacteraceae bacterium]MDW8353833.1 PilZ domain-containing protein [Bryobacterales bacterium]